MFISTYLCYNLLNGLCHLLLYNQNHISRLVTNIVFYAVSKWNRITKWHRCNKKKETKDSKTKEDNQAI